MTSNLHKLLRVSLSLATAAALVAAAPTASGAFIYNNLGAFTDGSDPILALGPLADSFSTGAIGGKLNSVQVLLTNGSDQDIGTITVGLYADSGTSPGALLISMGSLSSALIDLSPTFKAYNFAPISTFNLAANTRYWVEIQAATPNAVEWAWSNDITGVGVANQFSYSNAFGVNANTVFAPYQMAVQLPEPGSLALMCVGLVLATGLSARRKAS